MKVRSSAKYIRISPRKVRLVVDQVRGKSLEEAERVLSFMNKRAATPVLKVVRAAAADAVHNFKLDRTNLFVSSISANQGFMMKRFKARAFGRAGMIQKITTHVVVELQDRPVKAAIPVKAKAEQAEKTEKPAKKETPKQPSSKATS